MAGNQASRLAAGCRDTSAAGWGVSRAPAIGMKARRAETRRAEARYEVRQPGPKGSRQNPGERRFRPVDD